ncbi:(d)CMP kinase, partial [Francisella tularensis subsp. holarctica]
DRNRKLAPLRPANDAIIVDTSQLYIKEVFDSVIKKITI